MPYISRSMGNKRCKKKEHNKQRLAIDSLVNNKTKQYKLNSGYNADTLSVHLPVPYIFEHKQSNPRKNCKCKKKPINSILKQIKAHKDSTAEKMYSAEKYCEIKNPQRPVAYPSCFRINGKRIIVVFLPYSFHIAFRSGIIHLFAFQPTFVVVNLQRDDRN